MDNKMYSFTLKVTTIACITIICCIILALGYLDGNFSNTLFGIGMFGVFAGIGAMVAYGVKD